MLVEMVGGMVVKVGKYDVPDMRLYPQLAEATKKIYEKFGSEEATDTLTVAKLLGHKSDRSGSYFRKMSCLRSYGLVDKRGIKVTDVGKRLTYGVTEQERNEALKEALFHIPLWKEFYSRWGKQLPPVNFWVDLAKITGLEAPDAQRIEGNVKSAYLDDIRYLKPVEKPKIKEKPEEAADIEGPLPPTAMARFTLKDVGYVDIKDADTYMIAKSYMKVLAKKLNIKEKE